MSQKARIMQEICLDSYRVFSEIGLSHCSIDIPA